MPDPGIFQFVGESVDRALNAFVGATAGQVIADITPFAMLGATIYFALAGYMIIAGRIQTPGGTVMIQAVKFAVVAALALSLDGYNNWVVGVVHGLESGVASMFSGTGSAGQPMSVYATLDATLGKGWAIAADLWESAGTRGVTQLGMAIGEYVNAVVIALATLVVGLPAGAMIIVAKATLTLLLGIGPLFVMCLMWSVTARWFDQWLAQVMTAILTIALVAAVAAFMMKIFAAFVGGIDTGTDQNTLFAALSLATLSLVIMVLLYKTGSIASGLAGGISLGTITFGQMAAGAAGGAAMPGKAGRAVNNTLNPVSNRLDPVTGLQTTSRRFEHVLQGRSAFVPNPAYRDAVMSRYREAFRGKNQIKEG